MTQNYKPAHPPEFRQQTVELVALGKSPKQLSKEFGIDTSLVPGSGSTHQVKPDNCPSFGIK